MLKVGLTGGIASGKSVVRSHLESEGVATLDADRVVHGLFDGPNDVTDAVAAAFGDHVVREGSVDRKALGAVVFGDDSKRKALEAIVHPKVFEAIETFFAEAGKRGDALAVVDAALMFETGSFRNYERIVVAYCPPRVQLERLMKRDGLSREDALRRIESQMPPEEKRDRADYVVDTGGTLENTKANVVSVLTKLRRDAR